MTALEDDDVALTNLVCMILGTIPGWAWHPDQSPYAPDEVGVYYGPVSAAPDQGVGVRLYGATDDPQKQLPVRRVQLMHRGAKGRPDGADSIASASFATLQGLTRVGGISGFNRISVMPLGADSNRRELRSDNYEIQLDIPEE